MAEEVTIVRVTVTVDAPRVVARNSLPAPQLREPRNPAAQVLSKESAKNPTAQTAPASLARLQAQVVGRPRISEGADQRFVAR